MKRVLNVPLLPKTYDFGSAFEHFIILEFIKLAEYGRKDWRFFYLLTKDGAEIDLIVERPGQKNLCIEIKSSDFITKDDVSNSNRIGKSVPNSKLFCLSRDPQSKKIQDTLCLEWKEGLKKIFNL